MDQGSGGNPLVVLKAQPKGLPRWSWVVEPTVPINGQRSCLDDLPARIYVQLVVGKVQFPHGPSRLLQEAGDSVPKIEIIVM